MRTLTDAMATGLMITFEQEGRQFQEVYLDWQGRPLPEPGDEVACTTQDAAGLPVRRLVGTVLPTRRLEICRDVKDMLTLWVRLRASLTLVEQGARQAAAGHLTTPARHKPSPDGKANGRLGLPAKQSKAAQRGQTD